MEVLFTKFLCFIIPFVSICNKLTDGTAIQYSNCGPNSISSVDLSPCTSQPCVFHHGENATVTIEFTTDHAVSKVSTKVYGIVAGIPIPYALPNENGCVGCNLQCPLAASTNYKYINILPVLKSYPSIKILVKWTLVDEHDAQLVCFVFPMEIQ